MAQDITYDFSHTAAAVTITINSVGDTSNATSSAIDLGAQAPIDVTFEASLDGNSASNTDFVEWYIMWSQDNTDFTDANNAQLIHISKMNGATAFKDIFSCSVLERYFKVYFVNQSGDSMATTGNALVYHEKSVDQV